MSINNLNRQCLLEIRFSLIGYNYSSFGYYDYEESTDLTDIELFKEQLFEVFKTLTYREELILRLHFGIDNGRPYTQNELSHMLNMPVERIRHFGNKAIKKLRQPARFRRITCFVDPDLDIIDILKKLAQNRLEVTVPEKADNFYILDKPAYRKKVSLTIELDEEIYERFQALKNDKDQYTESSIFNQLMDNALTNYGY